MSRKHKRVLATGLDRASREKYHDGSFAKMSILTQKIPRARLYLSTPSLLKALLKLPFSSLSRGPATLRLEQELARHCGTKHARMVSTCRIGFYLVLKSLGLQKGDEVLLTPLTIPDMVNAVHTLGFKPVFVDISLEAQNIDVEDLKRKITPRSRVLLVTHLAGLVPDMQAILQETQRHRLLLVEDISQNWDARAQGKLLGTFGVAAVGSLSISKTLASVSGGAVLTDDDRIEASVRRFDEQLCKKPDKFFLLSQILENLKFNIATHPLLFSFLTYRLIRALCASKPEMINALQESKRKGNPRGIPFQYNPRVLRDQMPAEAFTHFCDLQAEVLLKVLKTHRKLTDERRELARHLTSRLNDAARRALPSSILEEGPRRNVYWHYPLVVAEEPRRFQLHLLLHGIDNGGYALALCSDDPAFSPYAASTPGAQRIKQNTVFLPIHNSFSRKQMEQIADTVNEYFAEKEVLTPR